MSEAAEMEDLDQLSDHEFRILARDFIEKHYPPELRNSPRRLHFKDTKGWYRTLARKGWLCPNWPKPAPPSVRPSPDARIDASQAACLSSRLSLKARRLHRSGAQGGVVHVG